MAGPRVDELLIADEAAAWGAAGFAVEGGVCLVGGVRLRLRGAGEGRGIVGWTLSGVATTALDGLPTAYAEEPRTDVAEEPSTLGGEGRPLAGAHANGVVGIDHVVAFTPDLDRTTAALQGAGLDLRRIRDEPTPGGAPRQAFFRLADVILEVVQAPDGTRVAADPDGPARLWGISFLVPDLDATAAALGDLLGSPRDAVQPGRRIATLRREAGLGPAIAFMSPRPA